MLRLLRGHVLDKPDGRFQKGERRSPATEFKPGQHWRAPQAFRGADWLRAEYVEKARSAGEIAAEFGVTDAAILFWLRRHEIPRRTVSAAREIKHWGVSGPANPMFGRRGKDCPSFIDGSSPERQRAYGRSEGREFIKAVLKRDGYKCRRCIAPKRARGSLHAHHIKPWAGNEALRFDVSNGVTLCSDCHKWVHSKANTAREFLA